MQLVFRQVNTANIVSILHIVVRQHQQAWLLMGICCASGKQAVPRACLFESRLGCSFKIIRGMIDSTKAQIVQISYAFTLSSLGLAYGFLCMALATMWSSCSE